MKVIVAVIPFLFAVDMIVMTMAVDEGKGWLALLTAYWWIVIVFTADEVGRTVGTERDYSVRAVFLLSIIVKVVVVMALIL